MKATNAIPNKIFTLENLKKQVAAWRVNNKTIAFSNGCFDILHEGHIFSLNQAASEADILIIGVNSDLSVKRLKGPERPINNEISRSIMLSNLAVVDAVVVFEEDTPLTLIQSLMPDVIVKGGDYSIDQIVGSKEVIANGGRVVINPIVEGFSTTGIIEQIKKSYS
ncbi:D-glycero-beta-D-manno-heptose 1-phosphate adenylyltransferase [Sediminibacterium sp.]|uniref:D-glycero-beta-D-manno-heptose 1-phosphate adenylyltransferase n=1 Tax=Sediminibacterium sp. TaxID=1917865 RepID=UPI0025ECC93A|nr:D-glycero-beta-D-manno-heptose 1-phosphate adenylyltransferase [Sediminibacterium sp.]MDO8995421.1 D-glycero-beta-D-manno-heptose 1-phosphate adenylyltransferase [Sediminibacterium sp.]MDO9155305.1 D-glycero-beta-D-manno-heptose 1-phosphate adenylyltransferase [Sediminibacterium sp.]MDP1972432.1 D-glycero-beta-D-manno-heptose 1-phosphate adenylyltransferase [Sediminibacterium sp.]MDP2419692.1 D-glycero-beta-D-manno-heptose 1-phosphate adenylyltransferase [Sediminibacterium sp.]